MPARFRVAAAFVVILTGTAADVLQAADDVAAPAAIDYFEEQVRPILVKHCYNCHSAETKPAGQLRVDDRNGLIVGGDHGAAIVPGDPDASLLIAAVTHTHEELKMPAEGEKLPDEDIATLRQWIGNGAVWPGSAAAGDVLDPPADYEELRRTHWAFQAVHRPSVPQVRNSDWPRSDIDRFVLSQ
jgi:mono/diheme cytochrome c family protein